ncbi:Thioredoxin-like [Mucilaginibacter pineti]|uniref:Thioredoxin-like n=1 Tax=Mucilaginibacter pineti TaxID=1391627 RepID=A0A1G6V6E8_9SPHI|nr:thioredoxin family protein [Mucilaginibacter pineti]SDD48577.1 Thioredoxin-like [Mucilaginibacter pineti]
MKKTILLLIVAIFAATASTFAQTTPPSSSDVLTKAYAQASKENKKVILIFHASWCGWCKKMEASLNDPSCKQLFDNNYVIATLDVLEQPEKKNLENPGSTEALAKFHGEKSGLPFWLVLDDKGKVLGDSQMRPQGASLDTPGENVGCPAQENEVAFFTQLLKSTSKLTDADLTVIGKRFALNKPTPVAKPAGTK